MLWWEDGFALALIVFPVLVALVGLITGALSNRYWAGAVAGAIMNVVLAFTVANDSLLPWAPIHAALGFAGGAIGCFGRRLLAGAPRVKS